LVLSTILLDAVTDKDPVVREQVCSALCALGEAQPEEALGACEEYLRQHEKLAHPYRTMILRAMETVVSGHISELDKDMARAIILLASSEMTRAKELVCDWQQAASSVLVAVGKRFIGKVMEELLSKFQPGALPHYFVVQTLANLAASNVFGMVPFLTSVLSTMLPMLGMAKHDTMRAAFCCALQYFSESTLEYLANLDQAPDPTVRKDTFATDIFSAYDLLFNHWLQSREAKLRLAVVEALGPMSHLLPSEKLEEQLPKLLPGVLALYKKHAETFHVSKVRTCTLWPVQSSRSPVTVVSCPLEQICVPVESSSPLVVSNQKEVLRCFTVLACCAPDRLLAFLLPKLDASNERTRVGTLQVVRHVINSAASQMEVKKPFILSSMRLPLLDTNTKVKRAVVQVISAMAHHGYLEQPGGEAMVEYIVQQCALPPETEVRGVRAISISTLYLVSTTVDRMSDVLWPYLLEFLTPVRFTGALTPLCKSLVHLVQKRQEVGADAFLIQYDVTLPSPYAITTRLLTVSSNPYLGDGRGAASLRLLNVLHRSIHPALGPRWATTVPLLLEHLDGEAPGCGRCSSTSDPHLPFLRDTLAVVSDNTWICQLSLEMCKQLPCYNGMPQEKNFLYKCIGTALGAASSKEVVRKQLQELLETARHQEEAEREGLACCFGICAISHLDDVLAQLEDFMRSDVFRKSTGIFNIFKDRSENEVEKLKCTLILCYGHVAAQAPRELVLAKVESDILRNIFQYFSTKVLGIKVETKDPALKLCLVQSVCMASQAICSSAQAGSFHFSRKAELVAQMMEFIKAEPQDSLRTPIRKKAMLACTYLVYPFFLGMRGSLWGGCPHTCCLGKGCGMGLERLRALNSGLSSLEPALDKQVQGPSAPLWLSPQVSLQDPPHLPLQALVPFHNLGLLIGLFSPRCADLWPATRQEAVSCVHALLYLQLGYEGFSRDYRDDAVERLLTLKEGLVHPDPAILFHTCHSIAQIIAKRLPPEQLISLLLTMFEGLGDPDKNCSRAATVMINCLLKERGNVLLEKVPEIVSVLRTKLQETREEYVLQAAQHSVYLLASQHCAAVVSSLLGSPLPFDRPLEACCWVCTWPGGLSSSGASSVRVSPLPSCPRQPLSSVNGRVSPLGPCPQATCALYEVMSALASGPAVLQLYPQLFAALLLRVSCTVGVLLPRTLQAKEKRGAGSALAMLLRGGNEDVVQRVELEGGWQLLRTSAGHEEGVARLASAMAKFAGPRLPLVMKELVCTQSSVYEIQRVTSTGFLAELLTSNVVNDLMLLESLLDNLAARQKDPCASVRRLVLRGLANMASGSPDKVSWPALRGHGQEHCVGSGDGHRGGPADSAMGFLVLHVEDEHRPQVDLEQLTAGEGD
uniref:Maestro heat like repeat family member 1 n=1 Tax=Ursus maritimus TaxID=29073 RepID=A0A452V4H8_URSMA